MGTGCKTEIKLGSSPRSTKKRIEEIALNLNETRLIEMPLPQETPVANY